MLVKDYMLRHPIMIEPEKRVTEAQRLLVENKIYYLPVVGDGKKLVGMITPPRLSIPPERMGSLDVWEITNYLSKLTVGKVMISPPELRSIDPDTTLEEAAGIMIRHGVGGLPVVDKNNVVIGLINDFDLLVELQHLLGATDPGWRVTVRTPSKRGEFLKLTEAISDKGWSIMAMGSVRPPKAEDHWDIIIKVWGCTQAELTEVVNSIEDHELRDIRETTTHLHRK